MGDSIDNIPGVRGVGEKTAVKLSRSSASVAKVYDNLTLISGKLRETLAGGRKEALLSRELVVLNREVPVELEIERFVRVRAGLAEAARAVDGVEFSRLLKGCRWTPAPVADAAPSRRSRPRRGPRVAREGAGGRSDRDRLIGDARPPTPKMPGPRGLS